MRLVILESPFAPSSTHTAREHVEYARACMKDCLARGEAPFASHLLYTQPGVLDDTIPEERRKGMDAGFAWRYAAYATVVYTDLGISDGMREGVARADAMGSLTEFRTLPGWST